MQPTDANIKTIEVQFPVQKLKLNFLEMPSARLHKSQCAISFDAKHCAQRLSFCRLLMVY